MADKLPAVEGWDAAQVRAAFPVLNDVVYLNIGTYGLMPEPALAVYLEALADYERRGVARRTGDRPADTRSRIAALLHADPEEIAFTRNATDGINLALAGLSWEPGDEVITTAQEHEAMAHPLLYLQASRGLRIRIVEVSPQPEVMLGRLEEVFTPRTRLVAMSHVTCETGTRLPAQDICRWAAERNLLSLFDGAQALGAFPLDVREMGCDFYTSNGHKWLGGPKGTGIFYARRAQMVRLSPAHVGAGSLERADLFTGEAELWPDGRCFEFGTRTWPLYAGLGASLDWFESLGWDRVYARIAALSGYFRARVSERPYLTLLTPAAFDQSSGLSAFKIEGMAAGETAGVLRERWHIHTRVIPHYNALRISTAHFNDEGDIETLLGALDTLHAGRALP